MFRGKAIEAKSPQDLQAMKEGGKLLGEVKAALKEKVKVGVSAQDLENLAQGLIGQKGATPSFKGVPGYSWATCVNVNQGLVHGIPKPEIVFKKGDAVSVDVGMLYKGFHTDTSFTLGLAVDNKTKKFLEVGSQALRAGINKIRAGARIYDISEAIEATLRAAGLTPIRDLVGHGIGHALHEFPPIPCFTSGLRQASPEIPEGATLAVEVMYTWGSGEVEIAKDGWTILMRDGKISALFEETVAALAGGPFILTKERL